MNLITRLRSSSVKVTFECLVSSHILAAYASFLWEIEDGKEEDEAHQDHIQVLHFGKGIDGFEMFHITGKVLILCGLSAD